MIKPRQTKHVRRYLDSSRIRQRRKKRKIILTVLSVCFVLALFFGYIYILRLPSLQYSQIEIKGAEKITREEISTIVLSTISSDSHVFGLVPYTSSLLIDDVKIENELKAKIQRIKNIEVDSHVGGVLEIDIAERDPFAFWCQDENTKLQQDVTPRQSAQLTEQSDTEPHLIPQTSSSTLDKKLQNDKSAINREKADFDASALTTTSALQSLDTTSVPGCYEMDVNGYVYGLSSTTVSGFMKSNQDMYVFKGVLEGNPINQTYLDQGRLTQIASFLKFLKEKNKPISYIKCTSSNLCEIYSAKKSKILIDLSQDINSAMDRLGVIFDTKKITDTQFEYIDLRFGNKVFFKSSNQNNAVATTTKKSNE